LGGVVLLEVFVRRYSLNRAPARLLARLWRHRGSRRRKWVKWLSCYWACALRFSYRSGHSCRRWSRWVTVVWFANFEDYCDLL